MNLDDIRPGDTVFVGKNTPRLVRAVGRDARGRVRSLTFAIRACSWTRRPYTVYTRTDLRLMNARPSGWPRATFGLPSDQELLRNIRADASSPPTLDCCDVRGWP